MGDDTSARRLTTGEIRAANARKRAFLKSFVSAGGYFAEGNRSKPLVGPLNPGCRTCIRGTWSCLYLNSLCTQDCFFCPQQRLAEADGRATTDDGLTFESPADYADYLRRFPFEGVGFSGGEPLRTFDRLLAFLRVARETLGARVHVWAYTNGDLATDDRLRELAANGLDELRFNLVPRGYDPAPLERAARRIPTVTVEIPVIPEDAALLRARMPDFATAGARYLNLHQLMRTEHNAARLDARGYAVTHVGRYLHGSPVVESEGAAFDLLDRAQSSGTPMGVNYCSRCYKGRFQEQGYRRRHAALFGLEPSSLTTAGYLRETSPDIPAEGDVLPDAADVAYYDLSLKPAEEGVPCAGGVLSFGAHRVVLDREKIHECRLSNDTAVFFFQRLFREGKSVAQTHREAVDRYGLVGADRSAALDDLRAFRARFEGAEHISTDLPDYD